MEVVFGLEHPVGPERVTLSLPPQVELNAAELSTFIAELFKVRDGMLPAILREDRAPLARCEHSAVMGEGFTDSDDASDEITDAPAEVCVLCDAGARAKSELSRPT